MTPSFNSFTGGGLVSALNGADTSTMANYGSAWIFDLTLENAVCSDSGGVNSIGCTAQNIRVASSAYPASSILTFANQGLREFSFYLIFSSQTDWRL